MSNKKQFGIWMDERTATVVGKEKIESGDFVVLGHVKNQGQGGNSSEKNANNTQQASLLKFFKEITSFTQNAEVIHITGTGTAQEQFMHFLADTPQFKNTVADESTSVKMEEEKLIEFFAERFN